MYLESIKRQVPDRNPKQVEAYMREIHGTLDSLTEHEFNEAIKKACEMIDNSADWFNALSPEDQTKFRKMMDY